MGFEEKCEVTERIEERTSSSVACDDKDFDDPEDLGIEARCIYAFVGFEKEDQLDENKDNSYDVCMNHVSSIAFTEVDREHVDDPEHCDTMDGMAKENVKRSSVQLLPHEKRGWWSSHQYDRRMRLRTTIMGAVNNVRTPILMDTGANVSIISESFARKLGLTTKANADQRISIQGIGKERMTITKQSQIKVTLGWQLSYTFTVWIGDHHGGANLILGTDFMMPAGVRLDLYKKRISLPDEVAIPIAHKESENDEVLAHRVAVAPIRCLMVDPSESAIFKIMRQAKTPDSVLWVREVGGLLPTILRDRRGQPKFIRVTNPTKKIKWLSAHSKVGEWVSFNHLPWDEGFVRESSRRYKDWQILITEHLQPAEIKKREKDAYLEWLSAQPSPLGARPKWVDEMSPKDIMQKKNQTMVTSVQVVHEPEGRKQESSEEFIPTGASEGMDQSDGQRLPEERDSVQEDRSQDTSPTAVDQEVDKLKKKLVKCYQVDEKPMASPDVGWFVSSAIEDVLAAENGVSKFEHEAADLYYEDFADELAMLPDFTELTPTPVNIDDADCCEPECTEEQKTFVKRILEATKSILIASGNALPPTARGVVCDIDVGGHRPIAQKSRRIPMKTMKKLFELLKGLLTSGLVKFSRSQWASPIVIVLKKNKIDIRLCIDYRLVNAITIAMEYPMPLVEDLLDNFEMSMWFCSLDAASGFWAIEMTKRASDISAFVCPLGHFQWLRMPFGLKNAPMIYQRMIDNALWGFVQPAHG